MRRLWKALLVVAVLAVVGTYVIYALDYQGNYNTTVSMTVSADPSTLANLYVTEFKVSSEPTSPVQFWDLFRGGHTPPPWAYEMYVELNKSGASTTESPGSILFPPGDNGPQIISVEFKNVSPGSATIRVYIVNTQMQAIIYDHTYSVVIGP